MLQILHKSPATLLFFDNITSKQQLSK